MGPVTPIIGITSYAEDARWAVWEGKAAVLGWAYVDAVRRAGGRPLLIPPDDDAVEETLGALDGLVLAGGADVESSRYGAPPHPLAERSYPRRDDAELALLRGALERDLPTLAICRGMQVLNVVRGGSLIQHLPDAVQHQGHREVLGAFSDHAVAVASGSLLERVVGREHSVKSHHHQAADTIGAGLVPVAWAADGTIEALEDPSRRFALGVQWHPEEGEDLSLFKALVDAARAARRA